MKGRVHWHNYGKRYNDYVTQFSVTYGPEKFKSASFGYSANDYAFEFWYYSAGTDPLIETWVDLNYKNILKVCFSKGHARLSVHYEDPEIKGKVWEDVLLFEETPEEFIDKHIEWMFKDTVLHEYNKCKRHFEESIDVILKDLESEKLKEYV